ncbi:MAG: RNase H1/viroplasmin domain-containing protein, partial [Bacteroidota bacterium]|nr:RNase H1/viroplasmin domain-containing protein [Bacteroidota bacterium]
MAKKAKFYVVWKGKHPGIFESWADCKAQIEGYKGAEYKSFSTFA